MKLDHLLSPKEKDITLGFMLLYYLKINNKVPFNQIQEAVKGVNEIMSEYTVLDAVSAARSLLDMRIPFDVFCETRQS